MKYGQNQGRAETDVRNTSAKLKYELSLVRSTRCKKMGFLKTFHIKNGHIFGNLL